MEISLTVDRHELKNCFQETTVLRTAIINAYINDLCTGTGFSGFRYHVAI